MHYPAQLAGPHRLDLLIFHSLSLHLTKAFLWKVRQEAGQFPNFLHPITTSLPLQLLLVQKGHIRSGGRGAFFIIPSGPLSSTSANFVVHYLAELIQKNQRTSCEALFFVKLTQTNGSKRVGVGF